MLEHIIPNRQKALPRAGLGRRRCSGNRILSTDWSLTADSFERFLCWLSPNREEAGWEYEQLRNKLVKLFTWRGCPVPEELFDETVNRVAKKVALGTAACSGRKLAYCYGVARLVLLEHWREAKPEPMPENVRAPDIPQPEWDEMELESLSQCLDQLSARDRDLITRYYQGEGREKIEIRREMACEGGGATALRIRIFRIRATLRDRISECVRRQKGDLRFLRKETASFARREQ